MNQCFKNMKRIFNEMNRHQRNFFIQSLAIEIESGEEIKDKNFEKSCKYLEKKFRKLK